MLPLFVLHYFMSNFITEIHLVLNFIIHHILIAGTIPKGTNSNSNITDEQANLLGEFTKTIKPSFSSGN